MQSRAVPSLYFGWGVIALFVPPPQFTLLEQKILLITGFTHIRLETLGSVKISAVDQQTPKEGEVCSEKFTGELIPNVPTVVAYHC